MPSLWPCLFQARPLLPNRPRLGFRHRPRFRSKPQPPPKYFGPILKPFHLERRVVAPAELTNSPRLESLVRGGNLYLSVQDVIALALENNLDIAVQRYSPFLAREVLRRAEGGGFLRRWTRLWPRVRRPSARQASASTGMASAGAADWAAAAEL